MFCLPSPARAWRVAKYHAVVSNYYHATVGQAISTNGAVSEPWCNGRPSLRLCYVGASSWNSLSQRRIPKDLTEVFVHPAPGFAKSIGHALLQPHRHIRRDVLPINCDPGLYRNAPVVRVVFGRPVLFVVPRSLHMPVNSEWLPLELTWQEWLLFNINLLRGCNGRVLVGARQLEYNLQYCPSVRQ